MTKITKAQLLVQNSTLKESIAKLTEENKLLNYQINSLKTLSVSGLTSSIVISSERISKSAAQIVTSCLEFCRRVR